MQHSTRSTAARVLVMLCGTMLPACATTPTTATSGVPCQVLTPLTFSQSGDTAETVRQIREQNAVIRELCP